MKRRDGTCRGPGCSASSTIAARARRRWLCSARSCPFPCKRLASNSPRVHRLKKSARAPSARSVRSAYGTSTSATCQWKMPRRRSPRFARGWRVCRGASSDAPRASRLDALFQMSSPVDADRLASDEIRLDQTQHGFRDLAFAAPMTQWSGSFDGGELVI